MLRRALRVLEFDQVLEHVAGFASTDGGREAVRGMEPAADTEVVRARLAAVAEVVEFLAAQPEWSFPDLPDPASALARLAVEGSVLDAGELHRLATLLAAGSALASSLTAEPEGRFSALDGLAADLAEEPALRASLERSVDREGRVLDSASRELGRIRAQLTGAHSRVVAHVESILAEVSEPHRVPGASITIREGRYVIPIRREGKRALGGYVHDESATGATVYVEPPTAVSMMNRIRELQRAEAREVQRVLRELTERCRVGARPLARSFRALVEMDRRVALARAAHSWDGAVPEVADWAVADWRAAGWREAGRREAGRREAKRAPAPPLLTIRRGRHPLLVAAGADPVPFDMALDPDEGVVVVTGPNAGGKTVFLKSVGLTAALAQSGVIPPVGPGTRLPVFDSFFADVGDQQSIADSLSTFSAHLRNLKDTVEGAGPRSLVLVDEPGTGTDPKEGEALGRALVETLAERGCTAVVTSHLGALKRLAAPGSRIVNASLEFDADRLMPTYRFVKGRPGRSYGLSIARGLGFPASVLDRAERYRDRAEARVDELLASLEQKERQAAQRAGDAKREQERVRALRTDLESATAKLRSRERAHAEQSKGDARRMLLDARKEVEQAIARLEEEVRRGAALEEAARAARRRVEEAARRLVTSNGNSSQPLGRGSTPLGQGSPADPLHRPNAAAALGLGTQVRLAGSGATGVLVAMENGRAVVEVGGVRMRVAPELLSAVAE